MKETNTVNKLVLGVESYECAVTQTTLSASSVASIKWSQQSLTNIDVKSSLKALDTFSMMQTRRGGSVESHRIIAGLTSRILRDLPEWSSLNTAVLYNMDSLSLDKPLVFSAITSKCPSLRCLEIDLYSNLALRINHLKETLELIEKSPGLRDVWIEYKGDKVN